MLTLTAHLDKQRYTPRAYVVAATDRLGEAKANAVEAAGREVRVLCGQMQPCRSPATSFADTPGAMRICQRRHRGHTQLCTRFHAAARLASPTLPQSGQRWLLCAQPSR